MKKRLSTLAVILAALPGAAAADNVTMYHNSPERHGMYKVPALTLPVASTMHLDKTFNGAIHGHVYAQPLFWRPGGGSPALVIVATESNTVYALNAKTGSVVWQTQLASSVPLSDLPCGDINPEGVTGTPVIDPSAGVLYLNALTSTNNNIRHLLYAISLSKGAVVSGWPLDVEAALAARGVTFSSPNQGERSALQYFAGNLYVNYGGRYGDCLPYNGTVIRVQTSPPAVTANWETRAAGGGIWAQGGVASDGNALYATTGNTFSATKWSDGEAILRLRPNLAHSTDPKDYFAPSNWKTLDNEDEDLGGTEALPLNIAVANSTPAKRVIAFGKDGNAYLADRSNLGGIGGALAIASVSSSQIITAPAVYQTSAATMVAFTNGSSSNCSGNSMTMLNIAASGSSPISVAWCAPFNGRGAPVITTTDGAANPIVWVVGAEGDNLLHGFNALTGQSVFSGGKYVMTGLHHFQTIMVAEDRFYVAADNKIYAFSFKSN